MSIGLILAPPLEKSPWLFLLTLVTLTPCLRSSALTVLMLSACNSPETFWPLRFTPLQRKAKTFLGAFCFWVSVAITASCNGARVARHEEKQPRPDGNRQGRRHLDESAERKTLSVGCYPVYLRQTGHSLAGFLEAGGAQGTHALLLGNGGNLQRVGPLHDQFCDIFRH